MRDGDTMTPAELAAWEARIKEKTKKAYKKPAEWQGITINRKRGARRSQTPVEKPEGCVHHWLIETPGGSISFGVCKKCGETRSHQNVYVADRVVPRFGEGVYALADRSFVK